MGLQVGEPRVIEGLRGRDREGGTEREREIEGGWVVWDTRKHTHKQTHNSTDRESRRRRFGVVLVPKGSWLQQRSNGSTR